MQCDYITSRVGLSNYTLEVFFMAKKRKDGRYQRKVTLSDGRQKIVYGKTLAELNAAADALRDEDRQGIKIGDNTLVGEWAKIWLEKYKSNLRPNTKVMYRNAYNKHIMDEIGNMLLRDVRPIHIRQIMANISLSSESLQKKVLITLRQLFISAQQNRLIVKDPTEGIKTTPHTVPEKVKYLTIEESKMLLEKVEDIRAKTFIGICLFCGLRREEALGLQWGDIKEGTLTVNRALAFAGNQPDPSQELKTAASHRTIPIPKVLSQILKDTPKTGIYVITKADGAPMTLIAFRRMWDKVRLSVPFEVRPHMLRHTYATNLYYAEVDLRTAQYLLGHSSITMTAKVYTHLEAKDGLAAADKINLQFSEIG